MGSEDEAELAPREWDGFSGKEELAEEGELQLASPATAGGWSTGERHSGSPEPKEQRVLAEGTSGEGGAEGHLDPEGQLEPRGAPGLQAPWGTSEVIEPGLESEDKAPGGGQAPTEVTLSLETARGEFASGAEQGLEQEVVELEDPGHLAREVLEPLLGEEGLEAKREQDLEGSGKDLQGAAALEPELPILLMKSRDPLESHGARKEVEPEIPWEAKEVLPAETLPCDESDTPQSRPLGSEEAEKDVEPVPGPSSSRPTESCLLTPVPEDAPGPQPLAEGSQEASWRLEGSALEKAEGEEEELGPGELPEGLQDDGEESRDESEADELGETLPDSTPLGVYLRSPASPGWGLAEEQRPSSQGETRKESWGSAVLTPEGHGAHLEEEEGGEEEEECGQDSDLSEEFEDVDVGTEGSVPPGVARELIEPPGQVSQLLLEPAAWGQDGESDGFADEEESGEEGEEEEEGKGPGVGPWGLGPSAGSLPAGSGLQSGNLLGSGTVNVSIPWDDGLRGAAADLPMTVLETESQDSTESSGSEEESAPLEREDQGSGPLGTLSGTEHTPDVNGQGPSLKKELEHVNGGLVNQLEQSDRVGQGKLEALEGDGGSPLEEEERGALKTPWAGAPLHLGPGQLLKFTQREGDGDSWSSGED